MIARPRWTVQLPLVFAAVILLFVAATAFSNWRLIAIDGASLDIANNSAPSIERLSRSRAEMRRFQVLLREYLDQRADGLAGDDEPMEAARLSMERSTADYLALPVFPGEQSKWGEIVRAHDELTRDVTRALLESHEGNFALAERLARVDVSAAADRLDAAITSDIAFNAGHSRDLALLITRLRGHSLSTSLVLDGACILLTIAGAVMLHRGVRAHADLADRHQQLLEARAGELEQFAGRVAHDILSPLGIVNIALEVAGGTGDEQTRARFTTRGVAALARVKRLVQGLLEFARAAAKPDPNTRTEVASTIADLAAELRAEAKKADTELTVETVPMSAVCNAGVLTSLVANLARNAIKYIGDGPVRQISIRAFERGAMVRVEVQDTGPGLTPGLEDHVFEPYVRAGSTTQPGMGLGLATVKRLAEAHRGKAGVISIPGEGCTFWFELPKAGPKEEAAVPAEEPLIEAS